MAKWLILGVTAALALIPFRVDAQTLWFKYESNPILTPGPAGSWDQTGIAPGRVIFEDSLYRMWYSATNSQSYAGWRVGHASSRDGAHWGKTPGTFILDVGPGPWESGSASWPEVIRTRSGYKMWYSGTDGPSMLANLRLGYATSPDGLAWTKFGRM